jgi:hypothetical protein
MLANISPLKYMPMTKHESVSLNFLLYMDRKAAYQKEHLLGKECSEESCKLWMLQIGSFS